MDRFKESFPFPASAPIAILGVPLDNVSTAETLRIIDDMIASRRPHYLVTANVDFLVQADGRPALIRGRPSGNARTVCVEKQLRAARFRTGVDRRATLRVPFEA